MDIKESISELEPYPYSTSFGDWLSAWLSDIIPKESGESPVFSSLVHGLVDDAEGYASGSVPLIRSESGWWLF